MIRLIVYIAILGAAALGFAWLADRPGEVTLVWQGQRIETDLVTVVIGLIALVVAALLIIWIIGAILKSPGAISGFFSRRRRERGWRSLSQGMIAVGAGDPSSAKKLAQDARKILGSEPLALLLEAQTAQLGGNREGARAAFESMLEVPETRLLGLRGLFMEAQRYGEAEAARHFAAEAAREAPKVAWAGNALLEYQAQARDWVGALETLDRNTRNKIVDRARSKRLRAVLMTARALDIEQGEPDLARALATEAHSLAPDLVPAAVLAGRLLTRNNDIRRAARILEAAWKQGPHPEIAEAYAHVRPGDSARDRLNRVKELNRVRSHHSECTFAVATAAMEAKEFDVARDVMAPLLAAGPTRRACLLMADIEEAETNDEGRIREWLSRAVRAPRDATWVADGFVSDHWAPVSPVTGRLDAFEWKVPPEDVKALPITLPDPAVAKPAPIAVEPPVETSPATIDPPPAPKTEEKPAAIAGAAAVVPAAEPEPMRVPEAKAAPSTVSIAPSTPDAAAKPAQSAASAASTAAKSSTSAPQSAPLRGSRPVAFPLEHAPDDPGPGETGHEEAATDTRFRLFN